MKAPAFHYARPASLAQAFELLQEHREDARLIAGGQTLLATLNMRLSEPRLLIDLRDVPGLRGISHQRTHIRIGALTRHSEIEDSGLIRQELPLLAMAAPHVAHRAIRNRGTIGGSLAYADPAAEWPACMLALDATLVLRSASGERRVKAQDFFLDLYTTALAPGEILICAEIPVARPTARYHFHELVRRHGDYAIVGLAASAEVEQGALARPRLAFMGLGTVPMLAQTAAAALNGARPDSLDDRLADAQAALDTELQAIGDLYHSAETKRHLARVLLKRAASALIHGQQPGDPDA